MRFYVANEKVGKEFLYLAWARVQEPNGTTNMDFELNQSTQLSSNGVTPESGRPATSWSSTTSQGGVNPTLGYHLWVTAGNPQTVCEANNSVPCWGKVQSLSGNFEARSIRHPSRIRSPERTADALSRARSARRRST